MNYFQPYSLPADQSIIAAWDSQLAELANCQSPVNALAKHHELFPSFAAHYTRLGTLPRGTRRALQRKLARAREMASIQPEWQRKLAGSLAGAALLLTLAQSATATTITVTTNVPDINDGDGKCSLIEAIVNANDDAATHPDCPAGDGADTIVLPQQSTLNLLNSYSALSILDGTPNITGTLTIQGNGARIVGTGSGLRLHIIRVKRSGDVTLQNLTLQDGRTGAVNYGKLTIENSTITGNGSSDYYINGSPHRGRGISNSGTVTISNSIISGNHNVGVEKSGGSGAGMLNEGVAYIIGSTFYANRVAGSGGGIYNRAGTLLLQNSTVAGNTAVDSQHRLSNFAKAHGGGIFNSTNSYLKIESSTVSGNMVHAPAGFLGSRSYGGGIANTGRVVVASSTISGNTATAYSGGHSYGGGVDSRGDLTLTQTIISGNTADSGPEVYTKGAVAADGFNLFGNKNDAGVGGFIPGTSDIIPKSPLKKILGSLKDNGGPTFTHALPKRSPAIDAAPVDADCPATDQRGMARPQGGGCDIGAVEYTGKSSSKKNNRLAEQQP